VKKKNIFMVATLSLLLGQTAFAESEGEQVFIERKPGYWIADVNNSAVPGMKVQYKECSNSETDKKLMSQSIQNDGMTKCDLKSKKSGTGVLSEMTCSGDAAGQKIKLVATFDAQGDFDKAFTIKGDMKMEGLPMPPIKMAMTYKYQGECPAGMKVGDMITEGLPGGPVKVNLLEQ